MTLADRIRPLLGTRRLAREIVWRDETGSTNDLARQLADAGAAHGTVVMAGHQTAGRGRRGREWVSTPGDNLYVSAVLRPSLPTERAAELVFVAAVALADAFTQTGAQARIKWPNDVELGDRKACGILSELAVDAQARLRWVVLGIGVNVNTPPEAFSGELADRATSLRTHLGRTVDPAPLASAIFDHLEHWLDRLERDGFAPVLDAWRTRTSTLGADVRATVDSRDVTGRAEDVDPTGALLVRTPDGKLERIVAGEVTRLRRQ